MNTTLRNATYVATRNLGPNKYTGVETVESTKAKRTCPVPVSTLFRIRASCGCVRPVEKNCTSAPLPYPHVTCEEPSRDIPTIVCDERSN